MRRGSADPGTICWYPGAELGPRKRDWWIKDNIPQTPPLLPNHEADREVSQPHCLVREGSLGAGEDLPGRAGIPGALAGVGNQCPQQKSWGELGGKDWGRGGLRTVLRATYCGITVFQILTPECLKITITENRIGTGVSWDIFVLNIQRSCYF